MAKAILSYKFKCDDFNGQTYNRKNWELIHIRTVDTIPPPFEDLTEGWYIDADKRIAYFYTKDIEDKDKLREYVATIKPTDYHLKCLVEYEYTLTDYDTESECLKNLKSETPPQKMSIISNCICTEGEIENCEDKVNHFILNKLNKCLKVKKKYTLIKTAKGPLPF